MDILFVNYGAFGNNSSNHIDGFAQGLARRGHRVGVIADGAPSVGLPGVLNASREALDNGAANTAIVEMMREPSTILHAWTPRGPVHRLVAPLAERGLKYVVHLEDDEMLVTASQLDLTVAELGALDTHRLDRVVPAHLSHPTRFRDFIAGADGVTVIVERLCRFAPVGKPVAVLEPGVDTSVFRQCLTHHERAARRATLGIGPETTVLMYHGGVHPAVQRDMFSLYTAVARLRTAGRNVVLLRCGTEDHVTEISTAFRRADGVIQAGFVPKGELPLMLDLADIYIQPGSPNPFNAHRLPSKLLDFLAMGRPVILPKANVGLRLKDGQEALILRQGGAGEIMGCVERLMSDGELAVQIGRAGRRFAQSAFQWNEKVRTLEDFYGTL